MNQALYRKYRSKSLQEVVGQEHITVTLANALSTGRISHAYLFTGPRGVGKTSVARILAHQINDLPYNGTEYLDIIEIDAASNRRIDDVRDLRDKVHISPVSAKYKVYIIDEVHMLTGEAFNALLKTLEEPPSHVIFILATTEVHKLPATIISRTQRYNFRAASVDKVAAHLADIARQESIAVDNDALQLIAEQGEGSFRDSINLLDQMANVTGGQVTAVAVEQTLGLAPRQSVQALLDDLLAKNHRRLTERLNELSSQGITSASLLPQLLRALAAKDDYQLLDDLLEVPRAYNPDLKLLSVLLRHSFDPDTAQAAETAVEMLEAAAQPPADVTQDEGSNTQPSSQAEAGPAENTARAAVQPAVNTGISSDFNDSVWQSVLDSIGSTSLPLQSVLKHGWPQFEPSTGTLTLRFQYKLHSKRLEDTKIRQQVLSVLADKLGRDVQLAVVVDASVPAGAHAGLDPVAKKVAEIMGGGEAISV